MSATTNEGSDDAPSIEEVYELIGPVLLEYFGYQFFLLIRNILGREKGFGAAVSEGNVELARQHAEKTIQALEDAIDLVLNKQLQEIWYEDRRGLQLLQTIEDAFRSARHNERHWLTKLAGDKEVKRTSQKDDPFRGIVEAKAAAILDFYWRGNGGIEQVGVRIACVLDAAGFIHKRSNAVSHKTITEWRSKLNACNPSRPPNKRNKRFNGKTEGQYRIYCKSKTLLKALDQDFEEALDDLFRCCLRMAPRMLASPSPSVGNKAV